MEKLQKTFPTRIKKKDIKENDLLKDSSKKELTSKASEISALTSFGYTTGKKLGKGSFALVITAHYTDKTGRILDLACKIVDKKKAPQDFLDKFFPRELEILTKIDHRNIIQIHSILQKGSKIFIFMKCAENGNLLNFIKTTGPVNERASRFWFAQMCEGVKYLHSIQIVHRDLKCENILLSKRNNVKIADFGFARYVLDEKDSKYKCQTYCGSAAYASPEIISGVPYDAKKGDVWSLGIILFIMFNGKMPFDDTNLLKLVRDQQSRNYHFRPKVGTSLSYDAKYTLHTCLEPDPSLRWDLNQLLRDNSWFKKIGIKKLGK